MIGIWGILGFAFYFSYTNERALVEKSVYEKLFSIGWTLVGAIDGDAHEALAQRFTKKDEIDDPNFAPFAALSRILLRAHQNNHLPSDIYTLVLNQRLVEQIKAEPNHLHQGGTEFILMSGPKPYYRHQYDYRPVMSTVFFRGEPAKTAPYMDDHGYWVSVYIPIKNSKEEVVALLEVDYPMDELYKQVKSALKNRLVLLLFLCLLTGIIMWLIIALERFSEAASRFVPNEFLQQLGKKSLINVAPGDSVQKEMTVFFSDIRAFTTLSEQMTPSQNFQFINSYLSVMGPIVRQHGGFIDKFIGDAIMALFYGNCDDALFASIQMIQALLEYNQKRADEGLCPIKIGIGLNCGQLMLGTVGESNRIDGTVISDAVNLAARIEGLTKIYGANILISEHALRSLKNPDSFQIRQLDTIKAKGKSIAVTVYEVLNGDPPEVREAKIATRVAFEKACHLLGIKQIQQAKQLFEACLAQNPHDKAAQVHCARCEELLQGNH